MEFITDLFVTSSWITEGLSNILDYVMMWINDLIFSIVGGLFTIFFAFAENLDLKNNFESLGYIVDRIMVLCGLLMMFKLLFSFIVYLTAPDQMDDNSKGAGALIKNTVIVVIMLVSVQFGFSLLYQLQTAIISGQVIPKLVLGVDTSSAVNNPDGEITVADQITYMSWIPFFVTQDKKNSETCLESDSDACENVRLAVSDSILGYGAADNLNSYDRDEIKCHTILSAIAGIFLICMLIAFIIDVGVRAFKLMFLEMISPIPIISYIDPSTQSHLKNWLKVTGATFIDLFLRIALIMLAILLFSNIRVFASGLLDGLSGLTWAVAYFLIFVSIFFFAKAVPELLKTIFGLEMGNSSINPVKGFVGTMAGLTTMAAGGLIGGVLGAAHAKGGVGSRAAGFFGGSLTGGLAGTRGFGTRNLNDFRKNFANSAKGARDRHYDTMAKGGLKNSIYSKMADITGQSEYYEKQISDLETVKDRENKRADSARTASNAVNSYSSAVKEEALNRFNRANNTNYSDISEAYQRSGEYLRIKDEYEKAKERGNLTAAEHTSYQQSLNLAENAERARVDREFSNIQNRVRNDANDAAELASQNAGYVVPQELTSVVNAQEELSDAASRTDVNISQDDLLSRSFDDLKTTFDSSAINHDRAARDIDSEIKDIKGKKLYNNYGKK